MRVKYRDASAAAGKEFKPLYPILSLLSYMLKAPLVKPGTSTFMHPHDAMTLTILRVGTDVVNSLNRQRNALEAFLKACIGLEGSSDLLLETRIW